MRPLHVQSLACVIATAAMALGAGEAFAQLKKGALGYMGEHEARSALFGIDMRGYTPTFGFEWRECITPEGETLYQTEAGVQRGRMRVSAEGAACFSYATDGYRAESCFLARRRGEGFVFEGDGPSVFVTQSVKRGITSCAEDDLVS